MSLLVVLLQLCHVQHCCAAGVLARLQADASCEWHARQTQLVEAAASMAIAHIEKVLQCGAATESLQWQALVHRKVHVAGAAPQICALWHLWSCCRGCHLQNTPDHFRLASHSPKLRHSMLQQHRHICVGNVVSLVKQREHSPHSAQRLAQLSACLPKSYVCADACCPRPVLYRRQAYERYENMSWRGSCWSCNECWHAGSLA